jgi:hypothetical protein
MKDDFENIDKKEIIDDLYKTKTKYRRNNINIGFNNPINQGEERYTLINEENELLLCNESIFKREKEKNNNVKIEQIYNGRENEYYYYINKEEVKEKYLKNFFELNKNSNDLKIDNENEEEMNKLYEEIEMMHPRKVVNREIKKYSFFSWLGFFCLKNKKIEKSAFFNLGFGITSYFKTIKLFVIIFFIISVINLICITYYSSYKTNKYEEDIYGKLLKTTLGNTKITTYNKLVIPLNYTKSFKQEIDIEISLNCSDKVIGKFILGLKSGTLESSTFERIINSDSLIKNEQSELSRGEQLDNIWDIEISDFNEIISNCFFLNECKKDFILKQYIFEQSVIILYYECINKSFLPSENSENNLMRITQGITISTLFILIFLYYYYKFAIGVESGKYYKNKVLINNYTLVLNNLKIKSDN